MGHDLNVRIVHRYWDLLGQPQCKIIISRHLLARDSAHCGQIRHSYDLRRGDLCLLPLMDEMMRLIRQALDLTLQGLTSKGLI